MDHKHSSLDNTEPEPKIQPIVLVTHPEISSVGIDLLKSLCKIIMCRSSSPKREEILNKCIGVHGMLWSGSNIPIDAELLDTAGPQLKVISVLTTNCDYIDYNSLEERNVQLGHTPEVPKDSVAELAIGLFLAAARRIHEGRLAIDYSTWPKWNPLWLLGSDIRGAVVGFFGMNYIGVEIAIRLRGFNIGKFIYTNTKYKPRKNWLIPVTFDYLLKESHFIFITCPLLNKTKYAFNEDAFNKMAPHCILINVSNGRIIDQNALYNALKSNKILSAAVDSCYPEPIPKNHPLLTLPNFTITPHIRTQTKNTKEELAMLGAQNILSAFEGKELWATIHSKVKSSPELFDY